MDFEEVGRYGYMGVFYADFKYICTVYSFFELESHFLWTFGNVGGNTLPSLSIGFLYNSLSGTFG